MGPCVEDKIKDKERGSRMDGAREYSSYGVCRGGVRT